MKQIAIAVSMLLVANLLWAEGLEVSNAYVRATLPGQANASAFATIKNPLDKPITLVRIHSKSAKTVELHTHNTVNGQMQMRKMDDFTLAAKEEASFKPGAKHIMLLDLIKPLQESDKVSLEICFDELCSIIELPVISVLNETATRSH
jgi:hypothetical protein